MSQANAEREQRAVWGKVTFWQQCDEAKVQLKAELLKRICSRDTGKENFVPRWLLSVS